MAAKREPQVARLCVVPRCVPGVVVLTWARGALATGAVHKMDAIRGPALGGLRAMSWPRLVLSSGPSRGLVW